MWEDLYLVLLIEVSWISGLKSLIGLYIVHLSQSYHFSLLQSTCMKQAVCFCPPSRPASANRFLVVTKGHKV